MNDGLLRWVLGVLSVIVAATAIGGFTFVWNANGRLTSLEQKVATDSQQDDMLVRHWKLHSWTRNQINTLRTKAGMEIANWPDL